MPGNRGENREYWWGKIGGARVICNMFYLTCGSCCSQWRLSNWRSELPKGGGVPQRQLITISWGSLAKLLPAGKIAENEWQIARNRRQLGVGIYSPFIFQLPIKARTWQLTLMCVKPQHLATAWDKHKK